MWSISKLLMCGGMTCVDDINLKNSRCVDQSQFTGQRHEYVVVNGASLYLTVIIIMFELSLKAYALLWKTMLVLIPRIMCCEDAVWFVSCSWFLWTDKRQTALPHQHNTILFKTPCICCILWTPCITCHCHHHYMPCRTYCQLKSVFKNKFWL